MNEDLSDQSASASVYRPVGDGSGKGTLLHGVLRDVLASYVAYAGTPQG